MIFILNCCFLGTDLCFIHLQGVFFFVSNIVLNQEVTSTVLVECTTFLFFCLWPVIMSFPCNVLSSCFTAPYSQFPPFSQLPSFICTICLFSVCVQPCCTYDVLDFRLFVFLISYYALHSVCPSLSLLSILFLSLYSLSSPFTPSIIYISFRHHPVFAVYSDCAEHVPFCYSSILIVYRFILTAKFFAVLFLTALLLFLLSILPLLLSDLTTLELCFSILYLPLNY